jgi:hypothetical protein
LATTWNKDEQQQDEKKTAELWAKRMKTTWKTFEETIRRVRNRSINALLVTDNDDEITIVVIIRVVSTIITTSTATCHNHYQHHHHNQ